MEPGFNLQIPMGEIKVARRSRRMIDETDAATWTNARLREELKKIRLSTHGDHATLLQRYLNGIATAAAAAAAAASSSGAGVSVSFQVGDDGSVPASYPSPSSAAVAAAAYTTAFSLLPQTAKTPAGHHHAHQHPHQHHDHQQSQQQSQQQQQQQQQHHHHHHHSLTSAFAVATASPAGRLALASTPAFFSPNEYARLAHVLADEVNREAFLQLGKFIASDRGSRSQWQEGGPFHTAFNDLAVEYHHPAPDNPLLKDFDPNNHPHNRSSAVLKQRWQIMRNNLTFAYNSWKLSGQTDIETFFDYCQQDKRVLYAFHVMRDLPALEAVLSSGSYDVIEEIPEPVRTRVVEKRRADDAATQIATQEEIKLLLQLRKESEMRFEREAIAIKQEQLKNCIDAERLLQGVSDDESLQRLEKIKRKRLELLAEQYP